MENIQVNKIDNAITVLIITFNEEVNIKRVLDKLTWVEKVLIIDSGSTDATLNIINQYSNVKIVYRKFDSFAQQCNFGLDLVHTEWVLSLDADYVLTDELIEEIQICVAKPVADAYNVSFRFCVFGYPLRSDNTTPRPILFKTKKGHYVNDGHAHRLELAGNYGEFKNDVLHDDRKELSRWFKNQDTYSIHETQKLIHTHHNDLRGIEKIRKTKWLAPFLVFFYCLFIKRLILDGWYGWHYTLQRTLVEIMFALRLIEEEKLKKGSK